MTPDGESLQPLPLPQIRLPNLDFSKYDKIILTTKVMSPLFPHKVLSIQSLGDLSAELKIENRTTTSESHTWDFNENIPFEANAETEAGEKLYTFNFPVNYIPDINSLLIVIDDNFMKFPQIFSNAIARVLVERSCQVKNIILLGASDKISSAQKLTPEESTLIPPEFITDFIGSVLSELIIKECSNFEAIVVPSEGPTGFEKLSTTTMQNLINEFAKLFTTNIDIEKYLSECSRNWRLESAGTSTQSGLYI